MQQPLDKKEIKQKPQSPQKTSSRKTGQAEPTKPV
jgi:hypothetical protein